MSANIRHITYSFDGKIEHVVGFGQADAVCRILIIPPLFDEMNRVRRVLLSSMRELHRRGTASFIADLPGTNESSAALADQTLTIWCEAAAAAASQLDITHIAAFRGGTLIDAAADHLPHWRLAQVKGASLLKTMVRTRIVGDKENGLSVTAEQIMQAAQKGPVELAGNILGSQMIAELGAAEPAVIKNIRTVNLGESVDSIAGSALWLRAEPQDDPAMALAIADDIHQWSAACGG